VIEGQAKRRISFGEPFRALRNKTFRWYWTSGFGATGAQGLQQFAMAWLVLDLTDGSVGQLGLVIFLQGVPLTLVALFGGVLADRYNRRNLLIISQGFTMTNLAILSFLTIAELVELWEIYVSAVGLGVMQAVTVPARQALIRSLVGETEMMNAVALNTIQQHTSRIIWPAAAGGLVATLGVGATLSISAVCGGFGVVCLSMVRGTSHEAAQRGKSLLAEVKDGIRFTYSTPVVSTIMTLGLGIGLLGFSFQSLAPGFAREEMGFSSAKAGLFMMSMGLGALTGSVLFLVLDIQDRLRAYVRLCAAFAIGLAVIAVNPVGLAAFPLMATFGFFNATTSVAGLTLLQTTAPQQYLGRIISLFAVGVGVGFLLALPIGVIGDLVGLRWPLMALGLSFAAWALWVGRSLPSTGIEGEEAPVAAQVSRPGHP
jgi:MFS family permease